MPVDFLTTEQEQNYVVTLQNPMTCNWPAIFILISGTLLSLTCDGESITVWE